MPRNLKQCVIAEYPKWVEKDGEQVLVKSEEAEMELEDSAEKAMMVEQLKALGKEVDLRKHKGPGGFATLKAYFEAVMSRESTEDGDSGNGDQ